MYRQTYLEVDCDILKNNIINIKENYPNYKYYFGVVKANAYGHGNYIINSLIEGGINYLAVATLEEAVSLRKFNQTIPILVLEPINLNYIEVAIQNNITVTVSNIEYFRKLVNLKLSNTLKFHLKINSGMNRLGVSTSDECDEIFNSYSNNSNLFLEGIFTHFATSGINDKHWDNQLSRFKEITKNIELAKVPIVHMGRSLTLVNHVKIPFCNGIRLGICMYGMEQNMPLGSGLKSKLRELRNKYNRKKLSISQTTTTNNLKLSTAITLCSEVIDIRTIQAGDFVGYGASFIANSTMKIATIPIGYADGISKNIKHVVINNTKFNVVGEVCMDMICAKVNDSVKLNDKVFLIGGDLLPVNQVARECGLSAYTLFANIGFRVPRVYMENGNKIEL